MLSKNEIQYLVGDGEFSPSYACQMKTNIKKKVYSLLDELPQLLSHEFFGGYLKEQLVKNSEASTFTDEQQVEDFPTEHIEALKNVQITMPVTAIQDGNTITKDIQIDAHTAYMENATQQEPLNKLLDCLAG